MYPSFSMNGVPLSVRNALYKRYPRIQRYGTAEQYQATDEVVRVAHARKIYLSAKQVPSATALRHPGSGSIRKNLDELLAAGFRIENQDVKGHWAEFYDSEIDAWGHGVSASQVESLSALLSSYKDENARHGSSKLADDAFEDNKMEDHQYASSSDSGSEFSQENPVYSADKTRRYRLLYDDPFIVAAAMEYAERMGLPKPKLHVWTADVIRLQDEIPARLLGETWNGKGKRGVPFFQIRSVDTKISVLLNHTHWGYQLVKWVRDKDAIEHAFALRTVKTLRAFISGERHPSWNAEETLRRMPVGSKTPEQRQSSRANRFMQVLETINGTFAQLFLACPSMDWTWSKFDSFVIGHLHMLLNEEFLDGEIDALDLESVRSTFADLKSARQNFKESANARKLDEFFARVKANADPVERIFLPEWTECHKERDRFDEIRIRGILVQTRGCGTPPPLVVLRAKVKFIETITTPPVPLTKMEKGLILAGLDTMMSTVEDSVFTGLSTKAGVRISTSACFEKTREEGGSAEGLNEYLWEATRGRKIYTVNLFSGEVEDTFGIDDLTPGEYIFWRCLEVVLAMPPEELSEEYLVMVKEPGKARSVTKGHIALKVVLDVVNGICSYPLGKGFESSESGMGKEAHAWNYFKKMFSWEDILFKVKSRKTSRTGAATFVEETVFDDAYLCSTDYSTATDFMHHEVAEIIGRRWMTKCGIPPLLQGIVVATCYRPCRVLFKGTGALAKYGQPGLDPDTRVVILVRGVLMGRPLTKVVLHMLNMIVRTVSLLLSNEMLGEKNGISLEAFKNAVLRVCTR